MAMKIHTKRGATNLETQVIISEHQQSFTIILYFDYYKRRAMRNANANPVKVVFFLAYLSQPLRVSIFKAASLFVNSSSSIEKKRLLLLNSVGSPVFSTS